MTSPTDQEFARARGDGVRLTVHVTARAADNSIAGVNGGAVRVRVTPPPADGAANSAVVALIARALSVPKSAVRIAAGASSRRKLVDVDGVSAEDAVRCLR